MIDVHSLTKRYGPVVAVDDLTFAVERGETFALIGPNGAGKTTTLRILLGLSRPDAGSVAIGPDRRAPSDPIAREALGYVPQRVAFPRGRSAVEVLRFFARLRGLPETAVAEALERVGLASHAHRAASVLSGGYLQRLSLAQALLADPAVLVLDEPTASLDPEATWEFRTIVERLQQQGKTILLCSHLLSEVERVADRVLILVDGRAAAIERMSALRERQALDARLEIELAGDADEARTRLAARGVPAQGMGVDRLSVSAHDGDALRALELLRASGVGVCGFEWQRPSLEETFLSVVRRNPHET